MNLKTDINVLIRQKNYIIQSMCSSWANFISKMTSPVSKVELRTKRQKSVPKELTDEELEKYKEAFRVSVNCMYCVVRHFVNKSMPVKRFWIKTPTDESARRRSESCWRAWGSTTPPRQTCRISWRSLTPAGVGASPSHSSYSSWLSSNKSWSRMQIQFKQTHLADNQM